jgi:predicted O-methyltransferase YrrM
MKRRRLAHWLAVCGACGPITWFSAAPLGAAENRQAEQSAPAAELESARQDFVKSFKRIGLNTTPGDAAFLRIMVEISGAKRGVEVGTATGYGAIHMGWALERRGGHLTTIEIDPRMAEAARQSIAGMKLEKSISVVEGDALKVIPKLEGEFDFVFLDAVKRDTLKYFRGLEPRLKPAAVIIVDNAIQSAREMQDFFEAVKQDPNYRMVILRASDEKKDGMAVVYKLK